MSHSQAVNLLTDKDNLTEEAGQFFSGGRGVLVLSGSSYPTTLNLQYQNRDDVWITLNAATLDADGIYSYDLPAGMYRMFLDGGTATNIYATLVRVVY